MVQCSACQTVNQGEQVIQCDQCKQYLTYDPSGTPNIQCSLCFHVTRVPDRFVCPNCRAVVTAPADAKQVSCTSCRATLKRKPEQSSKPQFDPSKDEPPAREEDACVVCLDKKKVVLIYPCGHLCVCQGCANKLEGQCPVCRGKVTDVVKVYA